MRVTQTPTFHRAYKKLHKRQRNIVDEAIKELMKNPTLGELKTGDLPDFRVHKFRDGRLQLLLAYNYEPSVGLQLRDLGSHENFYRDLKRKGPRS